MMPLGHILIALALQAAVGLAWGNWWAGAALGAAIYIGREQAQAEYRWIAHYAGGHRALMPWWGGFDPRVWNGKAICDALFPLAAVLSVGALS